MNTIEIRYVLDDRIIIKYQRLDGKLSYIDFNSWVSEYPIDIDYIKRIIIKVVRKWYIDVYLSNQVHSKMNLRN